MENTQLLAPARAAAAEEIIEPFVLRVPDADLADLRERLARTRWPDRETVGDTSQGAPLDKVRALVEYWRDTYDWRRVEAKLNSHDQYRTTIDGLGIHFLHIRSVEPDAMPLLVTHGWSGSVLEFEEVIGPLTDPVAHGGNASDAFHLVIPALPGYGFSDRPTTTGWGFSRIADAWIELMRRLGYHTWGAQGGDLGALATEAISRKAPAGLVGVHFNVAFLAPTADEIAQATPHEQAMLASMGRFENSLSGYAKQQTMRPQTVGYSLADSPAGLAAWLYDIYQEGSDSNGDPESLFGVDAMLDDITLYWLTNTGTSAARLYWELAQEAAAQPYRLEPNPTPAGFSLFPKEPFRASRRWIEKRYANVLHYNELPRGGHFAAWEQPELFAQEVRATFRVVR